MRRRSERGAGRRPARPARRAGAGERTDPAGRVRPRLPPAAAVAAVLALGLASPLVSAQATASPAGVGAWSHLERLRDALTAAPRQADFVQTFLPAGFSTGETETGSLALALPDCLRWDYAEPFAKSFLLCGHTVHTWNEGETSGRRQTFDPGEEQGLDLLKLSVEDLRRRYAAVSEPAGAEGAAAAVTVVLTPREPGGEITEARFTLDTEPPRLTALAYRDVEGNRTRFEFRAHRPLASRAVFNPPDIAWLED